MAKLTGTKPHNIIFILTDDHRYDAIGFKGAELAGYAASGLIRLARDGICLKNAYVTTSLCSPRRASILAGTYAHKHGIVDNPQPGFDRWVSFREQGSYLPEANGLNVDGKHVPQKGYITDELTG